MERVELLKARIALHRRYLSEGVAGDLAVAYLWLIRQDEIALTALPESRKARPAPAAEWQKPAAPGIRG